MTIDEAIANCLEVAKRNEMMTKFRPRMDYYDESESREDCLERASEQRQLAKWLTDYKNLREENKVLIEEKVELLRKSEQITEYKRLLKSATNVLSMFIPCDEDYNCSECVKQRQNCSYDDSFKWRCLDEALKLLGGE